MVIYLTNSRVWTLSPSWENLNEGFLDSSMTMMKTRFLAIHSWEAKVHKTPFKISWATWKENSSAALDCELQDFLIVILSKMALVAVLTSPHLLAIIKETSSFRIIGLYILMKAEWLLPNSLTINLNNNSSKWWKKLQWTHTRKNQAVTFQQLVYGTMVWFYRQTQEKF